MKKIIVAIGGGEIGKFETLKIDQEIVNLSNKKKPKVLFIPTASGDALWYVKVVESVYGEKLGCEVDSLLLSNNELTELKIEEKIMNSDIVYVGGGNTRKMMEIWDKHNIPTLLKRAYNKGIVMSGVSAGSICWYDFGYSDSLSRFSRILSSLKYLFSRVIHSPMNLERVTSTFIKDKGIGLIEGIYRPNFKIEERKVNFLKTTEK